MNVTKLNMALLASTVFMSACTLEPKYELQSPQVPSEWSLEQPEEVKQHAQLLHWEELIISPQLKDVIQKGLNNNHDLKLAVLNIEEARALYGIERANLLPNIDATGSGTRKQTPEAASSSGVETKSSTYEANLAVTAYELDLFGRVRSLKNVALQEWLATVEAQKAVETALIAEVANTYLTWLANKEILDLENANLVTQAQAFKIIDARYNEGMASLQDLESMKQSIENTRINIATYQQNVDQSKSALALLLGSADALKGLDNTITLDNIALKDITFIGTPSTVILNRPDIMAAEHKLKAQNANVGAARANFFPRITLTGSVGFASSDLSDLFSSSDSTAWSFMPKITLPIFQGGANLANLKASKVKREKAVVTYQQTIQTAFKEVLDELSKKENITKQAQAQYHVLKSQETLYKLADSRYKNGLDSLLDRLNEQQKLIEAQQQNVTFQKQLLSNQFSLYKALGGGTAVNKS